MHESIVLTDFRMPLTWAGKIAWIVARCPLHPRSSQVQAPVAVSHDEERFATSPEALWELVARRLEIQYGGLIRQIVPRDARRNLPSFLDRLNARAHISF